jgi:hypothetical protein
MDCLSTYKERLFYHGNFFNYDLSRYFRFMEFRSRRKQASFIGLIESPVFLIEYSLKTKDKQIINKL